jgi:hypothetical protein
MKAADAGTSSGRRKVVMSQSLPQAILTQVAALGAALVVAARAHPDGTLAEHERAVRTAVQAALPGLLGAVVSLATQDLDAGIAAVARRCPRCDRRVRPRGWRPRTVQTTCGPLRYSRPWYQCPACRHGFSPADATLRVAPRARVSAALEAWVVRLNVATTQREAAALLTELTGVLVGMDTIREHTTAVGEVVAAADAAAIAHVQATGEAAERVAAAPGTLVVEADGAMVRYTDGWHEVKVGVVGGVQDGDLTAASYIAAREPAEAFGPRLLAEAARRGALSVVRWEGPLTRPGLGVLRPVHIVGDGAPWIWNLAGDYFGERTEVVDFYHAAEHLWTVAHALYGVGSADATVWAQARIEELRKRGADPVRAALAQTTAATTETAELLRRERGYFATNAARMDYPTIAAQGLPIGSGAVESSAKHVVQQRMKRPGQRWSCRGATAMLALRARYASARPLSGCPSSPPAPH